MVHAYNLFNFGLLLKDQFLSIVQYAPPFLVVVTKVFMTRNVFELLAIDVNIYSLNYSCSYQVKCLCYGCKNNSNI